MIDRRCVLVGGAAAASSFVLPGCSQDDALHRLKVSVLKFGSLSWLYRTMQSQGIDKSLGLNLDIVEVATNSAGPIALMADEVDVIVSDWPWAMRQRSSGVGLKFSPYSAALGAVMVAPDGGVQTLADLKGKRLGVAGSPIDKSWILLQAYARKTIGEDLSTYAEPVYGAAPLVAEELKNGRVDAVLNFWTYSARLSGAGYKTLLSMEDVLKSLGVDPVPPLVGFVWKDAGGEERKRSLDTFMAAVTKTNEVMATSEDVWQDLRPHMKVKSDAEFDALRDYYRSGIPKPWHDAQTKSAENLLKLLIELGQKDLVGANTKFDATLFHGAAKQY